MDTLTGVVQNLFDAEFFFVSSSSGQAHGISRAELYYHETLRTRETTNETMRGRIMQLVDSLGFALAKGLIRGLPGYRCPDLL
jgi:hypothetical protein